MKALIVQNGETCPPLLARISAERCGYEVDHVVAFETDVTAVCASDYDGVVVLGGAMDATDYDNYPYLRDVERLVRSCVDDEVPLFAICLGAQQAAIALGSPVYRGEHGRELGWTSLQRTPAGVADPILRAVGEDTQFMEWHQDVFDLPDGATLLASSAVYPNQAFRYGSVFAVQFHPEIDERTIRNWYPRQVASAPDETPPLEEFVVDVERRTDSASQLIDAFWKDIAAR